MSASCDREGSTTCLTGIDGSTRLLVADSDEGLASFLSKLLSQQGYTVEIAGDGWDALDRVTRRQPDLALISAVMPGLSGIDVCRHAKGAPATRSIPVILMSAFGSWEQHLKGIEAGADDVLLKPIDTHEVLTCVGSLVRMKRYTDELESATSVMMTLAAMIEARHGYSDGHCHRLANYATALGQRLGFSGEELKTLRQGGFLHDIGMLAVPDAVLNKTAGLAREEHALIRSHTDIGASLIANFRSFHAVRPVVRHHHERFDGSGYPQGLRGDDIPLVAQIIGLVDAYEAMTSPRPYQSVRPKDQALEELRYQVRLGWWRQDLVEQFAAVIQPTGDAARNL